MKSYFKLLFTFVLISAFQMSHAQTAEEIVSTYLELIGGEENMAVLTSTVSTCTAKAQGMEIPVTMISKAGGKQKMDMVFQGKTITQFSFDGKEGWSTNFMTMEAEKMEKQDSEIMKAQSDFPDPFVGYAANGYTISKETDEAVEGSDCYQIKLSKAPIMIDGKEEANVTYYFFEKDSGALIMSRTTGLAGEMKGMVTETYLSDYDEVEGLYFPMTISQKMGGQQVFSVVIDKLEINTEVDDAVFAYPEKVAAPAEDK